ncbi:hypothetical protein EIP91_010460 [Steccherinum ochraceum]|uniref:Enoyl reductase (ER) domain-containing protein n=1 Tax=Steccherinum ochraceum TaxID=92696 RepID=A0A4R0RQP8_9APHY|nr:hypothetical protein EIP91_010460 [Steccherinum ochraceum]
MSSSIPTTQKALFIESPKGAWAVKSHSVPTPGAGEVLVRVEAAALNPVDWKVHDFDFFIAEYPAIIGIDSAGVVVALGDGVENVKVGDKVLHAASRGPRAAFQQYAIASAHLVAKVPPSISLDEAASIPIAVNTAAVGLYTSHAQGVGAGVGLTAPWKAGASGKYAGQPILVIGGSSAVGQSSSLPNFPVSAPSLLSSRRPTTLSSLPWVPPTPSTVTSPSLRLLNSIRKITSKPLSVVFDAVSNAATQAAGYQVLGDGGSLLILQPITIKDEEKVEGKRVLNVLGGPTLAREAEFAGELWAHLSEYLEKGVIKPNRIEVVPGGLAGIPDGLDRLRKDQVSGQKLVVHPQETV